MKNFRKCTALLVAMVLLAFPIVSLGEAASGSILDMVAGAGRSLKTSITFEPGEMLSGDPSSAPIADLLKALRLEAVSQKSDQGLLSQVEIYLQDKPSMDISVLEELGQFHLDSNLLEKPVSFTPEEYLDLYVKLMEQDIATLEKQDPAMAAMFKTYIETYSSIMKGMLTGEMPQMPAMPDFDQASLQQDLMLPFSAWITGIMTSANVTVGTYESDKHDTATVQTVYSLSASQLTELLTIISNWASKDVNLDQILSMVSQMNPEAGDLAASKEEIRSSLQSLPLAFAAQVAPALPNPFTLTILQDQNGNTPAVELNAQVFSKENQETPETTIKAGYYVKTEADGANEQLILDVSAKDSSFAFLFSGKDSAPTTKDGETVSGSRWHVSVDVSQMSMDAFDLKLDFVSQTAVSGATVKDTWKLGFEAGNYGQLSGAVLDSESTTAPSGADVRVDGRLSVTLTGMNAPIGTVVYSAVTGDPVEMPVIPKDSVRLGKMTMEELDAWAQQAGTYAMSQLMGVMQNLPASVLTLLYGSMAY